MPSVSTRQPYLSRSCRPTSTHCRAGIGLSATRAAAEIAGCPSHDIPLVVAAFDTKVRTCAGNLAELVRYMDVLEGGEWSDDFAGWQSGGSQPRWGYNPIISDRPPPPDNR
jgi:hypothetical protein